MTGKLIACTLSMFTFFFIFVISISLYIHICVSERVNDICYDMAETVSVRGVVTDIMFDYLNENIDAYGDFTVEILAEVKAKDGGSIFLRGIDQIKNKELSVGDKVFITAANEYPTLFEKLSGNDEGIFVSKVAVIN